MEIFFDFLKIHVKLSYSFIVQTIFSQLATITEVYICLT